MTPRPEPIGPRLGGSRRAEAVGRSRASPEQLWPLVGHAARWREWAGFTSSKLERPGAPDPDGVGAIRSFRIGPGASREQVLEWDPPHHLAYTILSGFPVRRYRADVDLGASPDVTGTEVRWCSTFDGRFPGTGAVMEAVVALLLRRFVRRLCRYGDSSAASS